MLKLKTKKSERVRAPAWLGGQRSAIKGGGGGGLTARACTPVVSGPARQAELTALLESYSQNVEKLRAEIANLTRRSKARYDCGHSLSDLIDMVESMNLSRKEVEERMQWVQQQMQREQKVRVEAAAAAACTRPRWAHGGRWAMRMPGTPPGRARVQLKAGAENLAKQYGASKNIDQKLLQEVFQQLKESNNKLSLLKVRRRETLASRERGGTTLTVPAHCVVAGGARVGGAGQVLHAAGRDGGQRRPVARRAAVRREACVGEPAPERCTSQAHARLTR